MVMQAKKSIGEVLIERGVLSEQQLDDARNVQKSAPGDLGTIIQDLQLASEKDVASARAETLGMKFVDLGKVKIDPTAIKAVPEHIAKRYNILPILRDSTTTPNKLMVAIGDVKTGAVGMDDVKLVSRCKITPVLATKSEIEEAIIRAYGGNFANGNGNRAGTGPLGNGNGIGGVPAVIKDQGDLKPVIITEGPTGLTNRPELQITETGPSELEQAIKGEITELGGAGIDEDDEGAPGEASPRKRRSSVSPMRS